MHDRRLLLLPPLFVLPPLLLLDLDRVLLAEMGKGDGCTCV